jgi:hypothetical protein
LNLAKCPDISSKISELERDMKILKSQLAVECLRRGLGKK